LHSQFDMNLGELFRSRPKAVDPGGLRLVVVEDGALGFESRVPPDDGEETLVIAQTSGELPANLVIRVASRIGALERSGRKIGRAILLVGNRQDAQVAAARWVIARALLSHLLARGGSELVLDADRAEGAVRNELLSLVEGLLERVEPSGVPIRLQFRRAPPRPARPSGIYPVPDAGRESPPTASHVKVVS